MPCDVELVVQCEIHPRVSQERSAHRNHDGRGSIEIDMAREKGIFDRVSDLVRNE